MSENFFRLRCGKDPSELETAKLNKRKCLNLEKLTAPDEHSIPTAIKNQESEHTHAVIFAAQS